MPIDQMSLELLKSIYDRCCKSIDIKPGNLLIKTMEATQSSVVRALADSTYKTSVPDPQINYLEEHGFVTLYQPNQYVLTAYGAWEVEVTFYEQNVSNILEFINNKKYIFINKKIDEKNKVILFATIAAHAFSEDSSIDLNKLDQDRFIALMECSYEGLKRLNRVGEGSFDNFIKSEKGSSKTPTAIMMSKINSLSQSTFGLFFSKSGKYWVNIYRDGNLDKVSLKKLLLLVFGKIPIQELNEMCELCKTISNDYGIHCCDVFNSSFEIELDKEICECLTEIAMES